MWHWTQGNQQRTSDSKKLLSTSMPCIISSWFRLSTVLYDDGLLFYYRILDYRSSYCLILPSGCLRFLMTPILSNKLRHTYREFPINFNSHDWIKMSEFVLCICRPNMSFNFPIRGNRWVEQANSQFCCRILRHELFHELMITLCCCNWFGQPFL